MFVYIIVQINAMPLLFFAQLFLYLTLQEKGLIKRKIVLNGKVPNFLTELRFKEKKTVQCQESCILQYKKPIHQKVKNTKFLQTQTNII